MRKGGRFLICHFLSFAKILKPARLLAPLNPCCHHIGNHAASPPRTSPALIGRIREPSPAVPVFLPNLSKFLPHRQSHQARAVVSRVQVKCILVRRQVACQPKTRQRSRGPSSSVPILIFKVMDMMMWFPVHHWLRCGPSPQVSWACSAFSIRGVLCLSAESLVAMPRHKCLGGCPHAHRYDAIWNW
jgi:hypothetical protein